MKIRMIVLAAVVGMAGTSLIASTSISGKYVEARTAEVFTGGCIMSREADTVGRRSMSCTLFGSLPKFSSDSS